MNRKIKRKLYKSGLLLMYVILPAMCIIYLLWFLLSGGMIFILLILAVVAKIIGIPFRQL